MRAIIFVTYGAGLGAITAILAGCAQTLTLPASGNANLTQFIGSLPAPYRAGGRPDRRQSWMLPDAKSVKELLYISDLATNDVYVYNYKTSKPEGTLTGFNQPEGQCVDRDGDVWIADYGGGITEFAHGGTVPLASYSAATTGCSIDPRTGNLAATIVGGSTSGIEVWSNGVGTFYPASACSSYPFQFAPGYDNRGNLFVEAAYSNSVCELPAGGTSFVNVATSWFFTNLGSVMWDGQHITFANTDVNNETNTQIIRATESPSGGLTEASSILLYDTCDSSHREVTLFPFIVGNKNTPANKKQGSTVIGWNEFCLGRFNEWSYSSGGDPMASTLSAPAEPIAGSVSIATPSPAPGEL